MEIWIFLYFAIGNLGKLIGVSLTNPAFKGENAFAGEKKLLILNSFSELLHILRYSYQVLSI
ncbi:hypothetical protein A6S26_10050 [Nostoc sp. ATCC 43529]|nr:hypothetical protein A6S26_10050 [Nostoc sp. ATCC 43529]